MNTVFILLLAIALDFVLSEPSNRWHPVAWVGNLIGLEAKLSPQKGKASQLIFGIAMVLLTVGVITAAVYFLLFYLRELNTVAYIIIAAILLKLTFSLRGLRKAATKVKGFIARDDLARARTGLKSLVSRDSAGLNKGQLLSATIESVAENSCDSFTAPLFYFLLFGIPGAVAYRIINTFDAMIGYHGQWEHLGKFAARLDDIANFIPARITAFIIVISAWICKKNPRQAWHIMLRDHNKTQSPNAGWTMSAVAGALEIQLEKAGHYRLGDNRRPLSVDAIDASLELTITAAIIWSVVIILAEVIYLA